MRRGVCWRGAACHGPGLLHGLNEVTIRNVKQGAQSNGVAARSGCTPLLTVMHALSVGTQVFNTLDQSVDLVQE